jgi:hypothetical protein
MSDDQLKKDHRLTEIVGTGKLLEHLQGHAEQGAVQNLVLGLEAGNPTSLDGLLIFDRALDLIGLSSDDVVVVCLVLV